jgi:hypothetical protein
MNNNSKILKLKADLDANPKLRKENSRYLAKRYNLTVDEVIAARSGKKRLIDILKEASTKTEPSIPVEAPSIRKTTGNKNNVLVIPDTHLPFEHKDSLAFLKHVKDKFDCGKVIHIGDVIDNYAISRYDKDPSSKTISYEYEEVLAKLKSWYQLFPEVDVTIGNHDARIFRQAALAGLPSSWLKDYKQILKTPDGWNFSFSHEYLGVMYQHGTNYSGENAAINIAKENRQSTVIGHLHTVAGAKYLASKKDTIFGMSVGCLVNDDTYAFAYGKENNRRSVLSCGVVLNGKIPIVIPM